MELFILTFVPQICDRQLHNQRPGKELQRKKKSFVATFCSLMLLWSQTQDDNYTPFLL